MANPHSAPEFFDSTGSLAIATLFLSMFFQKLLHGTEILPDGTEVELFRSYISGALLLGIAPCTAMVLVWGCLARDRGGSQTV